MKKSIIVFWLIIFVIATASFYLYLRIKRDDRSAKEKNFHKQIGIYVLDINKTALGIYSKDSVLYKCLRIVFRTDSTFSMNMRVPFMYDSVGKWVPAGGGLDDWNRLFYKSWNYQKYDKNAGNQFTQPWTKDSIFYINGATPQDRAEFIQEIYFRKISR
jgi:hypothetical protein